MSRMTSYDILGHLVTMPVEVRDGSAGTALFDVDRAAAQALVPAHFEVVESAPGRAQLAMALVDYRDNDLGAYHEVGIIVFVRPTAGGEDGTFIVHLPVDQPFTCAAGNQIWGFPKSVQRIDVTQTPTSSTWGLEMDGELVLRLTVPRGGTDEMPPLAMTTYTQLEGRPHATAFSQGGAGSQYLVGANGVCLELGSHPIARQLQSLGLPAPALLSSWTEKMTATFEQPRPL